YCARAAASHMVAAGRGGRIVLWSSVGARLAVAGHVSYSASKGGVESAARGLAAELGPHGITVNVIAPGTIDTPMNSAVELDRLTRHLPARRPGTSEEVAELALYLF